MQNEMKTMKSSDQRMDSILFKLNEEDTEHEFSVRTARIMRKWIEDALVIEEAVKEVSSKLASTSLSIMGKQIDPRGHAIGTAAFEARYDVDKPQTMALSVHSDGWVGVYVGDTQECQRFDVLTADKETYKGVIVTLVERAADQKAKRLPKG
jgi:hypothetical protein